MRIKGLWLPLLVVILFWVFVIKCFAEDKPLRPLRSVYPLQAISEPRLSDDGKSIVQIATQIITISKEQLLQRKAQLQKAIADIDLQLALFPKEEPKPEPKPVE